MRALARRIADRVEAVRDSLQLDYEGLQDEQFIRYCLYREVRDELRRRKLEQPAVLEMGRSNGVIGRYLSPGSHVVTGDYPAADVCNMPEQPDGAYDIVVLDQVLEHVKDPRRAMQEVRRVLRPGGLCILATPFLIKIHGSPSDYWRFTREGLSLLLTDFSDVHYGQWGNRLALSTCMDHDWLTTYEARRRMLALLKNEPDWPLVLWAIARK
jgi:SAM-dependent methyltransferase